MPAAISFHDCIFKKDVLFENVHCKDEVFFADCTIEGQLRIHDKCQFDKSFNIFECRFNRLFVADGNFDQCFWNLLSLKECALYAGSFNKLELVIQEADVEMLSLSEEGGRLEGYININAEGSQIEQLLLGGLCRELLLSLQNINAHTVVITDFTNHGTVRFFNLFSLKRHESLFYISNSYMGKTEYNSVNFASYELVIFNDTQLTDGNFVNTRWPRNIYALWMNRWMFLMKEEKPKLPEYIAEIHKQSLKKENYAKQRETYRQLKYAMYKQGDTVSEQLFHGQEMEAYDRSISWPKQGWTKLILRFSWHTSNFGQSVLRPILWLTGIHWLLFMTLVIGKYYPDVQFSLDHNNWNGFVNGFNYFFDTINPLHKTDIAKGFVFIDLLMRIWASYMIYNFIRASRRFIR